MAAVIIWSAYFAIRRRRQQKKLEDIESGKPDVELQAQPESWRRIENREIISCQEERGRDRSETPERISWEEERRRFPPGWDRSIRDMGVHGVGMFEESPRTQSPDPDWVRDDGWENRDSVDLEFSLEEMGASADMGWNPINRS